MWWDTNVANAVVPHACPGGAAGTANRNCTQEGLWSEPDFFNCTNTAFLDHQTQVGDRGLFLGLIAIVLTEYIFIGFMRSWNKNKNSITRSLLL